MIYIDEVRRDLAILGAIVDSVPGGDWGDVHLAEGKNSGTRAPTQPGDGLSAQAAKMVPSSVDVLHGSQRYR